MKAFYIFVSTLSIALITLACQSKKTINKQETNQRYLEATFKDSDFIDNKKYRVYLPPSYYAESNKKYPVLYMMDGNNLFANSEAMGGMSWNIHEVMDSLVQTKTIKECIIVGVDHAGSKRFAEYMPQQPMEDFLKKNNDFIPRFMSTRVFSDAFLQFLVMELKPFIDQQFRTKPTVNNTFIGGASMGGLISMYAVCEYPKTFAGALCLSTHWSVSLEDSTPAAAQALVSYMKSNLPSNKKWYFDYGTESLDQYYEPYQTQVDAVLEQKGYTKGEDWITRKYEGATHNELAWNHRLHIPLTFVLGN